jgi:recombinational DNA repair protein (RecF pathway)
MRLISCSECGSLVKGNQTSLVGHKRVCHKCKKGIAKKQEALFLSSKVIRVRNDGGEENDKMPVSRLQEKCK